MPHALLVTIAGTGGVLLMLGGLSVMLRPRRLWQRWYSIERRFRVRRFGGGWTNAERRIGRRGYFWIPSHIELTSPDDIYAYALSDGFWRSGYAWFVRALCWYSGALLIFFGLALLGAGIPGLP